MAVTLGTKIDLHTACSDLARKTVVRVSMNLKEYSCHTTNHFQVLCRGGRLCPTSQVSDLPGDNRFSSSMLRQPLHTVVSQKVRSR